MSNILAVERERGVNEFETAVCIFVFSLEQWVVREKEWLKRVVGIFQLEAGHVLLLFIIGIIIWTVLVLPTV